MTQTKSGTVAKKTENAVSVGEVSLADLAKLQGLGTENISNEDQGTPRIVILQQMSPELDGIENAKAGMILNKATNSIIGDKDGIDVLVCGYEKVYLEWQDRGKGSGAPVNIFQPKDRPTDAVKGDDGKMRLSNGNYLEESANFYVLVMKEPGEPPLPGVISMKGTQLKASRTWNYSLKNEFLKDSNGKFFPAPSFSRFYNLKTVKTQNDKGSWFIWSVAKGEILDDKNVLDAALAFYKSIKQGEVTTKYDRDDAEAKTENSEDIPF